METICGGKKNKRNKKNKKKNKNKNRKTMGLKSRTTGHLRPR